MSCFLWILLLLDAAYGGRTRARTWDPLIKSQLLFSMIDVTTAFNLSWKAATIASLPCLTRVRTH